jgi:hypothetical protein
MERFKTEYATGKLNTAQDYVDSISRIRHASNTEIVGNLARHLPEDIDFYVSKGGTEVKTPLNQRMSPTIDYVPGAPIYRINPVTQNKLNKAR